MATVIYTTLPNAKITKQITDKLLQEKLVGCVVALQGKSTYNWRGKREQASEKIVFLKTTTKQASRAAKRLAELHPYEVPCILRFNTKANASYEQWLGKETTGRKR